MSRHVDRTGPIGRLVRLVWAGAVVLTLASIVDSHGSARFRNPHILTEPSAWFLHGLLLLVFVLIVGGVVSDLRGATVAARAQMASIALLVATVVLLGAFGELRNGSVWGFPLADFVWYFDVSVLVAQFAAFGLAVVLGTPGCEIGVWPELIARARRQKAQPITGISCIVGIHLIDRWETRLSKWLDTGRHDMPSDRDL